jgi:uncharacterized protein DUF6286
VIRRPARVGPATAVALVLLAAAVLVAVSCVQVLLGEQPLVPFAAAAATAAALTPSSPAVLAAAGATALVGLLLVGAAVLPGPATVLPLSGGDGPVRAGVTRGGVRVTLAAAARRVDGVAKADVQVRRRRVVAHVRTDRLDPRPVTDGVREVLTARLADIDLVRRPAVRVRTSTGGGR